MNDKEDLVAKKDFGNYRDDSGRYRKKDYDRLARKNVEAIQGKQELTGFTVTSAAYVVVGFQSQEKSDKSKAGSISKKKEGITTAIAKLRRGDPDMNADAVWNNLKEWRLDYRWFVWTDGDRLYQEDSHTGKTASIGYNTFVRHYSSKASPK